MNKIAKPLYTDPEDIKNYENRKRIRRKLLTAAGGLFGGYAGGVIGAATGVATGGGARRAILSALAGAGLGAGTGALGMRKFVDFRHNYMESAGLDPTIPNFKAKLSVDGNGGAAKKAEALRKQADLKGRLGTLLGRGVESVLHGGGRYRELLRGSSATLTPYRLAQQLTGGFGTLANRLGLARAGETAHAKLQLAVAALRGELGEPIAKELAKVYATRAGTGLAGVAGVGLSGRALHSALSGDKQKKAAEAGLSDSIVNKIDPKYQMRGAANYLRLVDPPNVASIAGIGAGAGLIGSALLPGEGKSRAGRIAKGLAGAGLVGGGLYLANNDKARNAVREAVLGLVGRLGPRVNFTRV